MNRQRKVVITITYNEMGIIIDTKAEELDLSAQPEIVRCKDCGHWDTTWQNDFAPNYHYCPLVDGTRRDDFYCADAERRAEFIDMNIFSAIRTDEDWDSFQNLRNLIHGYEKCCNISGYVGLTDTKGEQE